MEAHEDELGTYDVVVIGAGHAGCEAALAAARMGRRTLLLTMNLDMIALMPCNPSVGGPAKGQLVREVDALGGAMGRNTDRTSIQIRLLNDSKGPAVQALRAQADKPLYSLSMKRTLEATPNLDLKQGHVEALLVQGDCIAGVRLAAGESYAARAVVVTTGTFLNGRILSGAFSTPAGRAGEFPARGLAECLGALGLRLGRLQTNTPPRVAAHTVRFALTTPQYGSETPLYFSFDGPPEQLWRLPINPVYPIAHQTAWRDQMPCYQIATNAETHRIIRANLHRSPVAPGQLDLSGPRYCPSIEEKIVRFSHKTSHQLFLEPEGWATGELYVQGCFTGLPPSVQLDLLRSIPALQEVEMTRPGYAIAYDYVLPQQLKPTLETRAIRGLFLAGQINGTSGYEEAAAQGLYAGANAACGVGDVEPLRLGRDQALLGVMIDDLITKELTEPYRMLTSRAEYRMLLRGDNADLRLTPLAYHLGLVDKERQGHVAAKRAAIEGEIARLKQITLHPSAQLEERLHEAGLPPVAQPVSAHQWLRRPGARYALVAERLPAPTPLSPEAAEQVEIAIQYEGYIQKQERQVERLSRLEQRAIPEGLRYEELAGLSNEARERLAQHRPGTVGQAARIQGVTPADVSVLLVHLERSRRAQPPDPTSGTSVR